ncbi:hypothetical protein PMIN04_009670 [Paraphaeosphaeria minitans]
MPFTSFHDIASGRTLCCLMVSRIQKALARRLSIMDGYAKNKLIVDRWQLLKNTFISAVQLLHASDVVFIGRNSPEHFHGEYISQSKHAISEGRGHAYHARRIGSTRNIHTLPAFCKRSRY